MTVLPYPSATERELLIADMRRDEALAVARDHIAWFQSRPSWTADKSLNGIRKALGFAPSRNQPATKRAETEALLAAIWTEMTNARAH